MHNRCKNPLKPGSPLGDNISSLQQISVDSDYPQIQLNQKEAIECCHCSCNSNSVDMQNLPEEMLAAIHENGLYDKYLTMQKMTITLPKEKPIAHLLNYIRRTGVMPGVEPRMKSMHVK